MNADLADFRGEEQILFLIRADPLNPRSSAFYSVNQELLRGVRRANRTGA
jgi:hypothetical protein